MKTIKVLIVDDEVMFRIGVKSCINWSEYGYELVGEASDGKQALELIKELKPDIVFTDIKMPVMDGLELTRNIVNDFPGTRVVILSCYNDFQYVKEALKLGAQDYILKLSMKPSDLVDLLIKMRDEIHKEKRLMQQESLFKQEFNVNINKLKEEFLSNLLHEHQRLSQDEFEKKKENLSLKINYSNNHVIVIKVDDYQKAITVIKDESLFQFAFINMAGEILNKSFAGEVYAMRKGVFFCIVSMDERNDDKSLPGIKQLIKEINISTKKYLNYSVSAGTSKSSGNLDNLHALYIEATAALDKGFFEGKEYFDYYRKERATVNTKIIIELDLERRLLEALETNSREDADKVMEQIYLTVNTRMMPDTIRAAFKELVYILNRATKRYDGSLFDCSEESLFDKIDSMDTLDAIKEWMMELLDFTFEYTNRLKSNSFRGEIIKVLDYIESNIYQGTNLKEASKIANMSEKYFCLLFKKETGKNFVDYINNLKTEKAKELLKNRDARTYEVARQLGFENEGYFSKVFKKYTGLTPQEYRRTYFQE